MLNKIYANTKETLRLADKLMVTLVVLIFVGMAIMVPAYAAGNGNSGSGTRADITADIGGTKINISQFSGLITDSFNDMMARAMNNEDDRLALLDKIDQVVTENDAANDVSLANVGNLLGIQSVNTMKKQASDVFSAGDDQASKRLTLDAVQGWYGNNNTKVVNSAMAQYILFGSALSYMGIDEFRDAQSNADGLRMIIGYAIYICFMMAYSAAGIMDAVLDILQKTNVFGWIHNTLIGMAGGGGATVAAPNGNNVLTITQSGNAQSESIFVTAAKVYSNLMEYRWVVFGLMVVLFVGSITVFKSKQMGQAATTQTRAKNLGLRVIIMCIGIPLVGMVYSTMLGIVTDNANATKYVVTDFIYSQFLDFEDWTLTEPGKAFSGVDGMRVVYETDKQSMDISFLDDGSTTPGSGNSNGTTGAVNIGKFVYNINRSMYDFVSAEYDDIGHTSEMFEGLNEYTRPETFGTMIDKSKVGLNGRTEDELSAESYKKARDLILGYARSNTVVAEVLNARFSLSYDKVTNMIYGGSGSTPDEDTKKAVRTVLTRIFDNAASVYRLWSYSDDDVYEMDGYGDFKIKVKGTPIFPKLGAISANYLMVSGGTASATEGFMAPVLHATIQSNNGFLSRGDEKLAVAGLSNTLNYSAPSVTDFNVLNDGSKTATRYDFTYTGSGMSTLALYNYMHSKFSLGTLDIYTPELTANSGVSTMHYSITTPYSGVPEVVQLIYTICVLFSLGIIGWVFGISLMLNSFVQMIKSVPMLFKMAIGSIQGFVEALLTVLSIIAEILVTMLLYTYSVQIINFLIAAADYVFKFILNVFVAVDAESLSIFNNLLSMGIILWGTFELIKWRRAITISLKSMLTHVLNTVFGTRAEMPSGASSGMLKAAAVGMTAAATAGALADQGSLDDVINDMTQSDLGSSLSDKLTSGDISGAFNDVKDFAKGDYEGDVRGGSKMDREAGKRGLVPKYNEDGTRAHDEETGEALYTDGQGNEYTASEMQNLPDAYQDFTEDQQASMDALDKEIETARSAGDEDKVEELTQKRSAMAAQFRSDNYKKAKEAGVADYATYERSLADGGQSSGSGGYKPTHVEPAADMGNEPSRELGPNEQMAWTAAKEGDVSALQDLGDTYNQHGLDQDQVDQVNEMISNGATEAEVAAAVNGFAQENFGDDYQSVVSKLNEANGRSNSYTYGSTDNSTGTARTIHVSSTQGVGGGVSYDVTDSNSAAGTQTVQVVEDGKGGVDYVNVTAGGGEGNTVETIDMGGSAGETAVSYANIYNGMAAMVKKGGGNVGPNVVGFGSAQTITVSELAASASQTQMGAANITVNKQTYGNSSAADISTATANVINYKYEGGSGGGSGGSGGSGGNGGNDGGNNVNNGNGLEMLPKAMVFAKIMDAINNTDDDDE